jgi:hypothetical protein
METTSPTLELGSFTVSTMMLLLLAIFF